ncbi:MAG: hypothetical protein WD875_17740 [Pirellulales bacterium]
MRLPLAFTAALVLLAVPLVQAHRADPPDATVTRDSLSRDDLDRAARDYRIAVYRSFRQNRAEFDRRNAIWRSIHAQWQRDGEQDGEVAMLVDWLRQATVASRGGATGPLPLPPEFGHAGETPPAVVETPVVEPSVAPLLRRDGVSSPSVRRADAGELPSVALPISPSLQPPQRLDAADIDNSSAVAADIPRRSAPAAAIDVPAAPLEIPTSSIPAADSPRNANGVDVNEVAIRVAGYNLALATLTEEIGQTQDPSIDLLVGFVERLEAQSVRASDLSPYFDLVDAADRARLRPLAAMDDTRVLLLSRIARAISAWTADDSVSSARRTEQLARLEELQRRVNQLAPTQ